MTAVSPGSSGAPPGLWQRLGRSWRLWLPVLVLIILGIVTTDEFERWLEDRIPRLWYFIGTNTIELAFLVIPVLLYLRWRYAAQRERAAYEQLKAEETLRDDLTHMLVHDLKNPLATAGLAVNTVLKLQGCDPESQAQEHEFLQMAAESHRRLERMVEDILDVARAEAGHMPLTLAPTELTSVVRAAVEEARPNVADREIALQEQYPTATLNLVIDADKIRRVVDNLLANALKFTPHGGAIEVAVNQADGEVQVVVRDSGEGIPPELQGRIFERFAQAEAAREAHRSSVGLGLTFCKLAVEAHGGRIWAGDSPLGGAAFTFSLPLNH